VKPRISQLDQSGATDGQVVTWDNTAGEWVPETPSTGTTLTVQDENSNVSTSVTQIDFQGAGVTATSGTGEVIVTIPGGSGASDHYFTRDSTSTSSGTVPTLNTAVATMSITTSSLATSRTAFVSFSVVFSGAHTNRFFIYVDGTLNWPATNNGVSTTLSGGVYHATAAEIPIALGTGTHTIAIYWNAADSTAAVTFIERSMRVEVIP
jgi:hypothetical protein